MSKISAEIIADSICNGHRITTMKVVMPRMILAEFNTHRMLSKNSASSRAIPFKRMLEVVHEDPFIPIAWQKDHSGMQGTQYLTSGIGDLVDNHLRARNAAIERAVEAHQRGATKQYCNRLLEPFMWHTVLVTATEYENFFHLRCPQYKSIYPNSNAVFRSWKDFLSDIEDTGTYFAMKDADLLTRLYNNKGQAEIHMMALAEAMWDARNESKPKELIPGQWHMPYAPTLEELKENGISVADPLEHFMVRIATARCAQTSYTIVGEDGKSTSYENLIDLHNSLLVRPYTNRKGVVFGPDDPIHTSPAEHCAQAMTAKELSSYYKGELPWDSCGHLNYNDTLQENHGWCHNLRGFKSYRSMIPNENRR